MSLETDSLYMIVIEFIIIMYVPKEVEIVRLGNSRVCVSGQDFIFIVITELEYKTFCCFFFFFPEFTNPVLKTGKVSVQLKDNGDHI